MPKCKICGVNALLLKVNEDGICKSCAKKIARGKISLPEKECSEFQEDMERTRIAKNRLIDAVNGLPENTCVRSSTDFVSSGFDVEDEMLPAAIECVVETGQASTSLLQRKLNLGYARAARIIDEMEARGIVGPFEGSRPRQVLISRQQWIEMKMQMDADRTSDSRKEAVNVAVPTAPKITKQDFDYMDGLEFEQFCAQLLRDNGFDHVEVTKGSGDFGIDILAGKMGVTFAIQCKCCKSKVGNSSVQKASSGRDYYNRMVGGVMANNYFTPQAEETAERTKILLWGRPEIEKMIAFQGSKQESL